MSVFAKREKSIKEGGRFVERPPFPRNIMMELNNLCNHSCSFCYHSRMKRKKRVMDLDLAKRVLQEAFDLGARECGLATTGEPLINPHIFEIARFAKDIGFEYVYFSSNGAALNEEKVDAILESGLDNVKFSINAGTAESYKTVHGSDKFEHVVGMVKRLHEKRGEHKKPLILVSCVVSEETQGEQDILREKLGDAVDDLLVVEALELLGPINVGNVKLPCTLPFKRAHVTSEGFLTACCADFENNLLVGDLNRMSLEDAWNGQDFVALRRRHMDGDVSGTLCDLCLTHDPETPYEALRLSDG